MLKLKIYEWIVLALTLLAVAGFFLPWIKVNVLPSRTLERLAAEVARQLRGDEDVSFRDLLVMSRQQKQAAMDEPLKGMSGLDLPGQVNRGNAEGLMARLALQTFFGSKGVEQKALLVYFYPVLAVVAFLMLLTVRQNRRLFLIPAVLILALYFWTRYRIAVTELERSLIQVQIGLGLWLSLYALLAISLVMITASLLPGRVLGLGGPGGKSKSRSKKSGS